MPETFPLPEPAGLEASYNRHLPAARALAADQLARGRGDAVRARFNLLTALKALEPHRNLLITRWNVARVDALFASPDIADALVFAAQRAEGIDAAETTLRADVARAFQLRDQLLSAMEAAAKFDLVPTARVVAIRAGKGPIDTALDLVQLVALYREHAPALANKTPVTPELLGESQTLGNSLTERLTPKDQRRAKGEPDAKDEAMDIALRLWTLTAAKHSEARKAGREVFGRRSGEHVPALQASVKPAEKPVTPEPVPA